MPLALEAVGVTKRWGAVTALDDAWLSIGQGEVHALFGTSGSGRSTICRILAGVVARDAGEIRLFGAPHAPASPRAARIAGVALADAGRSLVAGLTVAEAVFLGREPRRASGAVDAAARDEATDLLIGRFAGVAGDLSARKPVSDLAPDQRQIAEILKLLVMRPRLALFDEATAALGWRQTEVFFSILKDLRAEGVSSLLVTHRLHEVMAVADRATVLRDGRTIADHTVAEADPDALLRDLTGGVRLGPRRPVRPPAAAAVPRLALEGVAGRGLKGVTLAVRPGEILGLAGRTGGGAEAVLAALFGRAPIASGRILVDGAPVVLRRPRDAIGAGIGFVSGDRAGEAVYPGRPILENAALASLRAAGARLVRTGTVAQRFTRALAGLRAAHPGLGAPIEALRAGDRRKLLLARWLSMKPAVLLLDDPAAGVDLAARSDIFAIVRVIAETGTAVVVRFADETDVVALCHRAVVLDGGRVIADHAGPALDQDGLLQAMLGEAA